MGKNVSFLMHFFIFVISSRRADFYGNVVMFELMPAWQSSASIFPWLGRVYTRPIGASQTGLFYMYINCCSQGVKMAAILDLAAILNSAIMKIFM